MFGRQDKLSISAELTFPFIELLLMRLLRGNDLQSALTSMTELRLPPRLLELIEHEADQLHSLLDKNSGHFILLCAVLQTVKNEDTDRIIDALALLKTRMIDLLYSQGSADLVVFHGKSPSRYARELLQWLQ